MERIRKEVNLKLSGFSRITKVVIQKEPFEKTPSQKIKRFMYPKQADAPAAGETPPKP